MNEGCLLYTSGKMKKFLRVLALFLLPVALLYGLFAAVLVSTRELAGMEEIVAATLDGSLTLYGTSHHENFARCV